MTHSAKGVIKPGIWETPRDRQICLFVYRNNGVSGELLKDRFWSHAGSLQAAHNRLAQLASHGYVETTRMPSPSGVGSGKHFFGLGREGRRVVAEELGIATSAVARIRPPRSLSYFAHHLGVCRTRLLIERAAEQIDGFELSDWVSERDFRRQPLGMVTDLGKRCAIEPDGCFTLSFPYSSARGYLWVALEFDTGSENATKAIRTKLRHYLLLVNQYEFSQLNVWMVVPDFRRGERLGTLAREVGEEIGQKRLPFWFTTTQLLASSEKAAIASRIWQRLSGPALVSTLDFIVAQLRAQAARLGLEDDSGGQS